MGAPTTSGGADEAVLDDIDARPGSTTSLLRTTVGLYLRRLEEGVPSAELVRLAGDLGIPAGPARTAITRLKQKGLLLAEDGGYRLNPAAIRMLERGDRRIFEVRRMQAGDPWCLVSATIPEARRDLRHQLRRRLQFIGAGSVAPGLWIVPGFLDDEVGLLLDELGVREYATLFRTEDPRPASPLPVAVAAWWDLDALRAEHLRFQDSVASLPAEPFAAYVRLIDSWRVLPYVDPGLAAELLPSDWPGDRSFAAFAGLSERLAAPAWEHVRATAA
ncbi:PaaX family transcriptional regulator [Microbacterium bovistercoris]|uniref:PaaX family transcriptional regulator n=1 Tax=Microbacterium bovistercoris TaxID=2293570 RepID=UPI001FE7D05F|nr:PaaX family transcriptional regulator C-terminal domain-containing protein [Microbacterium bovistercoris]